MHFKQQFAVVHPFPLKAIHRPDIGTTASKPYRGGQYPAAMLSVLRVVSVCATLAACALPVHAEFLGPKVHGISGESFTRTGISVSPQSVLQREVVAINLPDYTVKAENQGNELVVVIPGSLVTAFVDNALRSQEGRVKDTEFNVIDIYNLRSNLIYEPYDYCGNRSNCVPSSASPPTLGGERVRGDFRVQHRERLVYNPFAGHWSHTPWISVSGNFSIPIYFQVVNGTLRTYAGGATIQGSDRWYGDILTFVSGLTNSQSRVQNLIQNELQNFNGLNLSQALARYGGSALRQRFGIDPDKASALVAYYASNINASVNNGNLRISVSLPSQLPSEFATAGNSTVSTTSSGSASTSGTGMGIEEVRSFVMRTYLDVFGRNPTQDEYDYWMSKMSRDGFKNVSSEIVSIHTDWLMTHNDELQSTIIRSYNAVLNRNPDSRELKYWIERAARQRLIYTSLIQSHSRYKAAGGK